MSEFPVFSSVSRVVAQSRSVFFHEDRVDSAILEWGHAGNPHSPVFEIPGSCSQLLPSWEHPCHFFDGSELSVRWIFTLDVLNHCFWPDQGEPVWTVLYGGGLYSGYWGLAASLKRAQENGVPVTDPHFLSGISAEDLSRIFSGQGRIPMFEERLQNLREAGSVILSELGGDVVSLCKGASGSAVRLVKDTVSCFPSFRDEADYGAEKVYFWKRAQIFASDLFTAFGGKKWGEFEDIKRLTAFADYKLPQVLRELGIISYAPDLATRVDEMEYLDKGSKEEVEIRAMTVWAVEKIRKGFEARAHRLTSAQVDNWLWQLGQADSFRKRPYHRCRTIFY